MSAEDDWGAPDQHPSPPGWPDSRNMVVLRSVGMFLLGLGSLLLTLVTYRTQSRNTERDIDLKQRTFDLQTNAEAARLATSVIPFLGCSDDVKRDSALRVLERFLPASEHAKDIAQALVDRCRNLSLQARSEISDYQQRNALQQQQLEFRRVLTNAREWKRNGHDGPAARLFYQARSLLPEAYLSRWVDADELELARVAYEEARFPEAADRFDRAFRRIP